MSKKAVVYKQIEIEVYDNTLKTTTIDFTTDASKVMAVAVELFKEVVGDKFNETHADKLIADKQEKVQGMLDVGLQCGMLVMHRVEFDDGTDVMPVLKVNKIE